MIERTFLVTGASKGIGFAISKHLANVGHHVVGISREPLASFPGTLVSMDLSDDKGSARAFVELAQRHPFDGVVNNAGTAKIQRLGEIDLGVVDELMRFNLHSPINAVRRRRRVHRQGRDMKRDAKTVFADTVLAFREADLPDVWQWLDWRTGLTDRPTTGRLTGR